MATPSVSPEQEVSTGTRAEQLLNDPLIKGALDAIGERIIEQWRACPVKDIEMREKLWMMFNIRHTFVEAMTDYINTGKFAKASLLEEVKRKDFLASLKEKYATF